MKRILLIIFCCLSTSCQEKPSLESVRTQFQHSERELIQELEAILSPQDFEAHEAKTSEIFEDIAEEMVLVNTFLTKNQDDAPEESELSEKVKEEMKRILEMPGGEEWLMRCQTKAVRLLDIQSNKALVEPH